MKARQVRLDRGKLACEAFEGELGAELFDTLARQAQRQVLAQTAWLSWLLPMVLVPRPDTADDDAHPKR